MQAGVPVTLQTGCFKLFRENKLLRAVKMGADKDFDAVWIHET
jgi:hypothetical protein